ncbi:MAG: ABC transporter substrate-binding protein [Clostridia bacterium]|nr:ABC transporter substrate-binding protein [Clostridia bacterium]
MSTKKILALVLSVLMALSLCACAAPAAPAANEEAAPAAPAANPNAATIAGDTNNDGQIDMGIDGVEVEVNAADEHMNSYEASTSGNWEAMFTPIEMEGRAIDMANVDLTPTAEELAAMQAEPAYGEPVLYYMADGCTSGPTVAAHLGYYEEAGLTSEGVKGNSYTEALGLGQATVAVGHIATMLVPVTNGVDLTFVGGAHIGCKSLYVLADSAYNTTADLKGTTISVPNGIGKSDYNITSLLLDADGINPQTDVTLSAVSADACITAMQNGEISAALLSDTFAYGMVKDGTLKCIRSLLDEDFADENCCIIAMNRTFTKENPTIAKKVVQAVQKAHSYMRENPEEATNMLIEQGWNGGDYEMNVMLNNSLQFGLAQDFTEVTLRDVVGKYIRLGLIASMDDVEEVMEMAWTPVL